MSLLSLRSYGAGTCRQAILDLQPLKNAKYPLQQANKYPISFDANIDANTPPVPFRGIANNFFKQYTRNCNIYSDMERPLETHPYVLPETAFATWLLLI